MSVKIIIKIFLTLQLLLLIFRQMIDFAGIQWLMIIINALAIIITITGFFGYLLLYTTFQIILILYNIYVICVYARIITLNTTTATLTFDHHHSIYDEFNDQNNQNNNRHQHSLIHHQSPLLPSAQLLSFDINSRSFWYIIVSNHISNLQAHLNYYNNNYFNQQQHYNENNQPQYSPIIKHLTSSITTNFNSIDNNDNNNIPTTATTTTHIHRHQLDESLVDLCVQYIEIAIASLHIFISILAIGLILLKYKLERDKFFRNNDKTTPPLPPYTINPQMNHYMSFAPSTTITTNTKKNSLYNQNTNNNSSVRRSSKRRRSTRSLYTQKSKSNSLGALNSIRANSSGSLRSTISKHGHHRKSASSLLMMNNNNNNTDADLSFISNNTIRSNAKSLYSNYGQTINNNNNNVYGTIINTPVNKPTIPLRNQQRQHHQPQQQQFVRHSMYNQNNNSNYISKFLTSDSETDNYYHTFTPPTAAAYLNNGLANPLYGKRNSYLDSSETAI